jgi:hypothetical protein
MDTDKIVDEWAKEHRFDYDSYKDVIKDLKERLRNGNRR